MQFESQQRLRDTAFLGFIVGLQEGVLVLSSMCTLQTLLPQLAHRVAKSVCGFPLILALLLLLLGQACLGRFGVATSFAGAAACGYKACPSFELRCAYAACIGTASSTIGTVCACCGNAVLAHYVRSVIKSVAGEVI
jgi:ABC-type amino acid transport system permease subunit